MKSHERHQLKENVFATRVMRMVAGATANRDRLIVIGSVVAVLAGSIGGYAYWRRGQADIAGERLGEALAIQQAAIVPASRLPGATQASGTYPTQLARDEAAVVAFQTVAEEFAGQPEGLAAQYHSAAALMALGRYQEAEAGYEAVADAGSSIYSAVARLGRAEALARLERHDEAVAALTDLAADRDGSLPVDGVLIQLAEVHLKAGQKAEARAAFQRVVDEFPQSPYVAHARQQLTLLG